MADHAGVGLLEEGADYGVLHATSNDGAKAFVAGGAYLIEYSLSGVTAGTFRARLAGGTAVSGASRSAAGSYSQTLIAASGNATFALVADAAFAGSVTIVRVRRVS